jgi:hypothetical protein
MANYRTRVGVTSLSVWRWSKGYRADGWGRYWWLDIGRWRICVLTPNRTEEP